MRRVPFVVATLAMQGGAAFGVVDVQVLAGKGAASAESAGGARNSARDLAVASAHVAPIPLVPVSFGAEMTYQKYDSSWKGGEPMQVSGWSAGPEVMAWVPGLTLSPYAKVSGTVYGKYEVVSADASSMQVQSSSLTGPGKRGIQFGGGLKWSPFPVLSALGEFRQSAGSLPARTFLLGLAAGI